MGSIGWYILGYLGLGVIVWVLGAIGLVVAAAVNDIQWDMKNDPSMKRADTIESLRETAEYATDRLEDQCQVTGDAAQNVFAIQMLKNPGFMALHGSERFNTLMETGC